jgi:hypothetical protein
MRELALHILDVIENSIRAGAGVIAVSIEGDREKDLLTIMVEDNGPGIVAPPEAVMDPFYTTKKGKNTGLGLALFRASAEQAGGSLALRQSPLGGLAVIAVMRMSHVDRVPLGDLAATLSSVVCTNPRLDLRLRFRVAGQEYTARVPEMAQELNPDECSGLGVARLVAEKIRSALASLNLPA